MYADENKEISHQADLKPCPAREFRAISGLQIPTAKKTYIYVFNIALIHVLAVISSCSSPSLHPHTPSENSIICKNIHYVGWIMSIKILLNCRNWETFNSEVSITLPGYSSPFWPSHLVCLTQEKWGSTLSSQSWWKPDSHKHCMSVLLEHDWRTFAFFGHEVRVHLEHNVRLFALSANVPDGHGRQEEFIKWLVQCVTTWNPGWHGKHQYEPFAVFGLW